MVATIPVSNPFICVAEKCLEGPECQGIRAMGQVLVSEKRPGGLRC